MIFLVNRAGDVSAIAVDFIDSLDDELTRDLWRGCAWCPTWEQASELSRKRRKAWELLKQRHG